MVRHHGAEDNTLGPDDCRGPRPLARSQNTDAKLLIYRLFQEGRVLAQDGFTMHGQESLCRVAASWNRSHLQLERSNTQRLHKFCQTEPN